MSHDHHVTMCFILVLVGLAMLLRNQWCQKSGAKGRAQAARVGPSFSLDVALAQVTFACIFALVMYLYCILYNVFI